MPATYLLNTREVCFTPPLARLFLPYIFSCTSSVLSIRPSVRPFRRIRIQVNVAVIIDASGSVIDDDFDLEKEFAKNVVASFASRNLFDNGGSASFAQFSGSASEGGTFFSSEDFDAFVDADPRQSGSTNIPAGVAKGRELLNANPSTASFLILITDGVGGDPTVRLFVQLQLLHDMMSSTFL